MSGPKVIRVVTREELVERCEASIARVEAALAWRARVLARNDLSDEQAEDEAASHRARISALLAADRFDDVQRACDEAMQWTRVDVDRRLDARADALAAASRAHRTLKTAARALLERASAQPDRFPAALLDELRTRQDDSDPSALQSLVARVQLELGRAFVESPAGARRVAEGLADGAQLQSVAQWMGAHGVAPAEATDPKLEALERGVERLATVDGDVARSFRDRLAQLAKADVARRGLLRDSIALELQRAMEDARAREALRQDVEAFAAEAQAVGAIIQLRESLDAAQRAIAAGRLDVARTTLEAVRAELEAHARRRAAEAGRTALLAGLRELGYEVHEGMVTAWANEGRLALRSSLRPQHGVELGGRGNSGRFQVRVVAEGLQVPAVVDAKAETHWCGELTQLRERLAATGTRVDVERAIEAGVQPIKRARLGSARDSDPRREDETPSLHMRTLDRD